MEMQRRWRQAAFTRRRRQSVIAHLASHRVIGKGPDGYREALEYLVGAAA